MLMQLLNITPVFRMGTVAIGATLALSACDEAKKPAAAAHHEPAVQKVMANPEKAPVANDMKTAKAGAPAAEKAPKKAAELSGKVYGAGVTAPESVNIGDLKSRVDEFVGKRVRVEGLVADVCPMRGCWFNMAGEKPGESLRFKVRDGVMVFPMSAKGKYAVAEGVVRKIPLNLEQTKRVLAHEAEEKGEQFDPTTVTEAITLVRLDGVGAVIRDNK